MSDLMGLMKEHYDVFALDERCEEVSFDPGKSYENILFKRKKMGVSKL